MDEELPNAMMGVAEAMLPIIEFCEGQRAELERRGWSPTAAESYALQLLTRLTDNVFTSNPPRS